MVTREMRNRTDLPQNPIAVNSALFWFISNILAEPPPRTSNEKFRVQNDTLLSMDSMSTILILKRLRSPRPGKDLRKSDWILWQQVPEHDFPAIGDQK